MSTYKSSDNAAKGSPNLEHMQYLQDNWGQDEIAASLRVNKTSITASGSSGVDVSGVPVGAKIIDVIVHPTATSGGGTVTLSVGGGGADISDAIACAAEDTIGRAGSIDQTYKTVTSDGLTLTTNADADKGDVYIYYMK
jgi:hypothetical protein